MIVSLEQAQALDGVRRELTRLGLWIASVESTPGGEVHLVIAPSSIPVAREAIERIAGVRHVSQAASAHPKVDAHGPSFVVAGMTVSAAAPALVAGPCSVESEAQIHRIAKRLGELGVKLLRGGAFKPRTSPYAFQGKGRDALVWLREAATANGLGVVTEVLSERDVGAVSEHADVLQVGSRNMHNYALLKAIGGAGKPVLLKRSMAATIEEWLLAGEYLLSHGAPSVVFCERGIRTFDDSTRNLLDLGAVALLSHVHRLPVIVDPSHATGRRDLVGPLSRAALAAGAAGLMIEVHDDPASAQSDGAQALHPNEIAPILEAMGRPS